MAKESFMLGDISCTEEESDIMKCFNYIKRATCDESAFVWLQCSSKISMHYYSGITRVGGAKWDTFL